MSLKAIVHSSELLTGAGVRAKDGRRVSEADLGRIEDGALVYSTRGKGIPDRIEWVGPTSRLPKKFLRIPRRNLKGRSAVVPGFVDCHTHLIFAGDRSDEFALRCAGATYSEIAERGGGIAATVRATRAATSRELERLAIERLKEARSYGVKTVEIKSGYGLDRGTELRILGLVPKLRKKFPDLTLTATFLGAHDFPRDRAPDDYFREVLEDLLPEVAKKKLADSCDIFVDEGYYSVSQARALLSEAKKLGLRIKIHADELKNTEAAALAAALGALSADHLLKISKKGIQALARSETVAVLLPGTAFYLKAPQAPARALIDAGACVAISTDFNPGTCMTLNLPAVMTISALYLGMSRAEIFAAVTYNAAKALGLAGAKGTLETGRDADWAILPFARFEETYYRFAHRSSVIGT